MAAKQSRKGNAYYIEFDGESISPQMLSFDPGIEEVTVDSTAGQDEVESQFKIRDKVALTGQFEVDDGDSAFLAKMKVGTTGVLVWGPKGNTTGYEKWGVDARLVKANVVANHGDRQIFDCMWINIGRDWLFDGRTDTF